MRGTRVNEDPRTGIRIQISRAAQIRIGGLHLAEFIVLLHTVLEAMGAQGAYVSKAGTGLEISVIGCPFKVGPWKLQA